MIASSHSIRRFEWRMKTYEKKRNIPSQSEFIVNFLSISFLFELKYHQFIHFYSMAWQNVAQNDELDDWKIFCIPNLNLNLISSNPPFSFVKRFALFAFMYFSVFFLSFFSSLLYRLCLYSVSSLFELMYWYSLLYRFQSMKRWQNGMPYKIRLNRFELMTMTMTMSAILCVEINWRTMRYNFVNTDRKKGKRMN